jgi:hypothetical protein
MKQERQILTLSQAFPPSTPCSCDVCKSYCKRPGWWTVEEAAMAIHAGHAMRMMLEVPSDLSFGVLSPAFSGCEGNFALQEYSERGCCFLKNGQCKIHGTGFQPLECRFCHHDRNGQGQACHEAIEKDWHTQQGQHLVLKWAAMTNIWQRHGMKL